MGTRNINKDLYPTKWLQFLKESYSENEAIEKYWKFCRSFCEEKYILKFGLSEGNKKYKEKFSKRKFGNSLINCIERYGETEGIEKFNEWKSKTAGNLKNFIKRYGETEGLIKYNNFRKRCIIKDEIKNDPNSKFNNRSHNTTVEFYIEKYGVLEDEAKKMLSKRQSTSKIDDFIYRYGEEIGVLKYQEANLKKINNLYSFIGRYGEIEGTRRYYKYVEYKKITSSKDYFIRKFGEEKAAKICKSRSHTLENYILKYGEEKANEKYKQYILNNFNNRTFYSKSSLLLFDPVFNAIKDKFEHIFYKENEYVFYINNKNFKVIMVDFYVKDVNKVIEFNGDYWHRNKLKGYVDKESEAIQKYDENRLNTLREIFNCEIMVVWQSDFLLNTEKYINDSIKFLIK
jgi:hypothetical protein